MFSLQLSRDDLNQKMLLGMQADSVLDQSSSMWLPGTTDTVSADGDGAARLPWVARLGPGQACSPSGSHFSSTAATHVTREKNLCKA